MHVLSRAIRELVFEDDEKGGGSGGEVEVWRGLEGEVGETAVALLRGVFSDGDEEDDAEEGLGRRARVAGLEMFGAVGVDVFHAVVGRAMLEWVMKSEFLEQWSQRTRELPLQMLEAELERRGKPPPHCVLRYLHRSCDFGAEGTC
jgi:hypothetical protein